MSDTTRAIFRLLQNMGIMIRIYSGRVGGAAAHSSPVGGGNAQNADAGSVSCCGLAAAGVLCKQTELKSTRSLADRLRLLMFAARRQAVAECEAPKSNLGGGREDIFRLKRRRVRGGRRRLLNPPGTTPLVAMALMEMAVSMVCRGGREEEGEKRQCQAAAEADQRTQESLQ